jgi:hypothetical protein
VRRLISFLCAAAILPATAAAAAGQAETVTSFLKAVKSDGPRSAERFLTPRLLLANTGSPDDWKEIVRGAYSIHLAVENIKVGRLNRFVCQPAGEERIDCTLYRRSLIDKQLYRVSQTFFVRGGEIYKVIIGAPELSRG